jgi:sugar phosphate permease
MGFPGIKPSNLTVTATWSANGGTTWSATSTSHNVSGDLVRVVITYQYFLSVPYGPAARTLSMTSSAQTVIAD